MVKSTRAIEAWLLTVPYTDYGISSLDLLPGHPTAP